MQFGVELYCTAHAPDLFAREFLHVNERLFLNFP